MEKVKIENKYDGIDWLRTFTGSIPFILSIIIWFNSFLLGLRYFMNNFSEETGFLAMIILMWMIICDRTIKFVYNPVIVFKNRKGYYGSNQIK